MYCYSHNDYYNTTVKMAKNHPDNSEFPNLVLLESNSVIMKISASNAPDSFSAPNAAGKLKTISTNREVRAVAKVSALKFAKAFCCK